jgi:hypothetical protein
MSAPSDADPSVPVERVPASAPVLAAAEGGHGNTGGAIEAEVSRSDFQSSTLMLTPFAGTSTMTGMTLILQLP